MRSVKNSSNRQDEPETNIEAYIDINSGIVNEVNDQIVMAVNPATIISPVSSGSQKTRNNMIYKKTDASNESRSNLPIRITRNQSEAKTIVPRKLI